MAATNPRNEMEGRFARRLTWKEQADLPCFGWKNPRVDVRNYYVTFTVSWEVDKKTFDEKIADGMCGQEVNGKYILVNH